MAELPRVRRPHILIFHETVPNHEDGRPLSVWQGNPAVEQEEQDAGKPAAIPRERLDFDGNAGTSEHSVWAEGPDPVRPGLSYRVLARRYTNALVLAKLLPEGSSVNPESATVDDLGAACYPLRGDGSLGPAVTAITLRNNEGAIRIPAD